MSAKPRIRLPDNARIGEVIEIKTLIAHPMESGNRRNNDGGLVPRLLLHACASTLAGREAFRATLHTGTAAKRYIPVVVKVPGPGEFEFTWIEDGGAEIIERQALKVI